MKAALALVVLPLLLAGCAHTAVTDMGNGRHLLTATAPSGGYAGSREEAVEEANQFCGRNRQAAVTDGFYDKTELGAAGEHTSTILFRCAAPPALSF
jgi:hypothetical protein